MACPKCQAELVTMKAGTMCPECGYAQNLAPVAGSQPALAPQAPVTQPSPAPNPKRPHIKRSLVYKVSVIALTVLIVEGGIDGVIAIQPMAAWFLLFLPLAILWAVSYALLISLPFAWPASLGAAWLLDRAKRSETGMPVSTVLIVNAWTLLAAGIYFLLAPHYDGLIATLGADMASVASSLAGVVPALFIGLCVVPAFWSIVVLVRAQKQHRFVGLAAMLMFAGIAAGVVAVFASMPPILHKIEQKETQYHTDVEDRIKQQEEKAQKAKYVAREGLMQFTPYEFGADPGMTSAKVVYGGDKGVANYEYGSASVVVSASDVHITQVATARATPVVPGKYPICLPNDFIPPNYSYGTTCRATIKTPGGVDVYTGQFGNQRYYFVRDGVFFDLSTTRPAAGVPAIIDGLKLTSWKDIDEYAN